MWIEKSNFRISGGFHCTCMQYIYTYIICMWLIIIILLIFFQSIEDRLKAINAEAAETSRYFPH